MSKFSFIMFALFAGTLILAPQASIKAAGTYATGEAYIRLTKFAIRGFFYKSYEAEFEWASFKKTENCAASEHDCFTPIKQSRLKFSIQPHNQTLAIFLNKNINRVMLVRYHVHKFKPLALESKMEVVDVVAPAPTDPNLPAVFRVPPTGTQNDFAFFGKVLRLEKRGNVVKSYEGLYYNKETDKVHSFSITSDEMADYIYKCMAQQKEYYIGVSVAYATALRESSYDIYEINFNQRPFLK